MNRQQLVYRFLRLKMIWGRGLSHFNVVRSVIEVALLFALFVKVYDIGSVVLVWAASIAMVVVVFAIGMIDVAYNVYDVETSMNNQHNPEIMKLARRER